MGHNHNHSHQVSKNIKTAFFLNLSFTIIEIIGGFYTNNLAIISDATHDLGDNISLGLACYLDGKHHILTTHVIVEENSTREDIQNIKNAIQHIGSKLHLEHITVEIEYPQEYCQLRV